MWIFIAIGSSLFYGFSNVLDNFLTNRLFKNIWALVFLGLCFDVLLIPLVFLISPPQLPPLNMVPLIVFLGFLEVIYLIPYYKALKQDDTSVVSSLFALGRIFIPIFAFFIVGEVLHPAQYLGFFLIILSSTLLTLKDVRHLKINKSFFYMVVVAIILALDTVTYKYVLNGVGWSTAFVWVLLSSWGFSLCFLLSPKVRENIWHHLRKSKKSFKILALEEFMAVTGNFAGVYVLSLVPVTLARGIGAITPFVVLMYGAILQKFFPKVFHENVERSNVLKKIFLFVLTLIGVFLVVNADGAFM